VLRRRSVRDTLWSLSPGQVGIRRDLRKTPINDSYDAVLMQSEFTTDILQNRSIGYRKTIIRVDNDEYGYALQTARAEQKLWRKLYYLQEAVRIKRHSSRLLPKADVLWFVSHEELSRYREHHGSNNSQAAEFLPTAIDLRTFAPCPLKGSNVLFVGSLHTVLNREAVEWYIKNVHPKITDVPDYNLVIAGSTGGKCCEWLHTLTRRFDNVQLHLDYDDLSDLYSQSAVFVNPMQGGAGVKIKTVEAIVRGLPIVSTTKGVEGIGLLDDAHFKGANTGSEFAERVREFLQNRKEAKDFVQRSQTYIFENYDQARVLARVLVQSLAPAKVPSVN